MCVWGCGGDILESDSGENCIIVYITHPWQEQNRPSGDTHSDLSVRGNCAMLVQLFCAGTLTMAGFGTVFRSPTVPAGLLGSQAPADDRRGGCPSYFMCSKLQHGALDSGKQGGGPQAHRDTCSFELAPVVAGPGEPGWDSPCIGCCVSHQVYSCLTE